MADLTAFLVAQLEAHGLRVTGAEGSGTNLLTECFNGHGRRTPCLSIRKRDGAFNCFSCKAKGRNVDDLIRALGGDVPEEDLPDPFEILGAQVTTDKKKVVEPPPPGLEPWRHGAYRGLSEGFLQRVGAAHYYDDKVRAYRIWFPIYQNQKLEGWVARRLDAEKYKKYNNATNLPAQRLLYPYDFCADHFDCHTVVLVEGPMDALRLCHFRIPTLAILGTNNWRDRKRSLLYNLGTRRVVICTDSDDAGRKCRNETLEPALQDWFEVEHFFAPEDEDPGSMDRQHCLRLKRLVEQKPDRTFNVAEDRF